MTTVGNISSREFRKKIQFQRNKIKTIKDRYSIKLKTLDIKKRNLEMKTTMISTASLFSGMSKIADKKLAELEELNSQIEALKNERDSKLEIEKELLNKLTKTYRENRGKLSANDRRLVKNKRDDIIDKIKDNKLPIIILGVILIIGIIAMIASAVRQSVEKNRDYYINVNDSYEFNCDIGLSGSKDSLYCKEQTISGNFSNYETVGLKDSAYSTSSSYTVNGNNFTKTLSDSVPYSYYGTDDFDKNSLNRSFEVTETIALYNTILKKNVSEKIVKIKYNLSDADIDLIVKKHDEWVTKKAEEAKRRAEEEEKSRQEAEARKQQEEQRRREEEQKQREEEAKKEAEKRAEEESKKSYKWKKIQDGETCPSNTQVCYVYDSNYGYPSYGYGTAKGRVINNTNNDFNYIQVTMATYNSSDVKTGDCFANSAGLKAGSTWAFEASCSGWTSDTHLKDLDITWW